MSECIKEYTHLKRFKKRMAPTNHIESAVRAHAHVIKVKTRDNTNSIYVYECMVKFHVHSGQSARFCSATVITVI